MSATTRDCFESERDMARRFAAFLEDEAAELPVDSDLRALALQSAGHWTTIAGGRERKHLALVTLREVRRGVSPDETGHHATTDGNGH